jgi:DNA-binding phage protein
MALTRSYKETVMAELKKDPEFRKALYGEAINALLEGEQAVAFSMLRDIVHSLITFKRLAEETGISEKSLHRMLGVNGNPTIQNIGKILKAIQHDLGYIPQVSVNAA